MNVVVCLPRPMEGMGQLQFSDSFHRTEVIEIELFLYGIDPSVPSVFRISIKHYAASNIYN